MDDWLTAEAVFIDSESLRIKRTGKNLRNIGVVEKAVSALKNLGFTLGPVGVVSITISAKKEIFEQVFKVQFKEHKHDPLGTKHKDSQISYYGPINKPIIPKEL